ncbi:hypothetical protein CELD12_18210 [Cellulomonas sp. NTE-D12]|nr:hypothetical protein CELD12_18210 [Cellulomonas sp. NTE-D12]
MVRAEISPKAPTASKRDSGIAMVVAVAVVMMVTAVVATVVVLALRETGLSGRERQRAVSIASAEGQVDNLVSQIDHASISSLTNGTLCGTIPAFTTRVGPDPLTITSTVTYFRADGTQITNCSDVASGAAQAQTAAVQATSKSTPLQNQPAAVRHFETIINLHLNVSMKQAIFGNTGVEITNNNTHIYGENGTNNGDVYSNGYVDCRGEVYGSIYAQTTVTLENTCDYIAGNIAAVGNVTSTTNGITLLGSITSSHGNIALDRLGQNSNQEFDGKAWAYGTVTGNICPNAKCNSNSAPNPPPSIGFPQITAAQWTDPVSVPGGAGFVQINFSTCVADFNNPQSLGYWLYHNGPTLTQNTLVRMPDSCTVDFTNVNGHVMYLNKDVAIFAKGTGAANGTAFNFTGSPNFAGTAGPIKNLYFIQDYQTPQCSKIGININNAVDVRSTNNIRALFYTPNQFYSSSGTSNIQGQIFSACTAEINNQMNLTYSLVPVTGIQNINSMSYSADIVAKRETSS